MRPIKRIVVTGDVLRINEAGRECQNINIRWLFHLVRPALAMLVDLSVQPLLHDRVDGNLAQEIYRSNDRKMWLRNWVELYEQNPSESDLAHIGRTFSDALVLAFELPDFLRKGLLASGIPYIDLTIHPVRFLDDLAFGIRSNIAGLLEGLRPWVLAEDDILIGAGLARATLARLPAVPECAKADGWALFACQTRDDKVLIRDGALMQATDFAQAFVAMAARHERILVKPHPVIRVSPLNMLKHLVPNMVEVDANFYHLLAQDGISHVYSITSSTSVEAPYFGKVGTHLARYPYVFSEAKLSDVDYLQIRAGLHLPQFWAPLLRAAGVECRTPPAVDTTLWPNRMRRSLRNAWGADILMDNR